MVQNHPSFEVPQRLKLNGSKTHRKQMYIFITYFANWPLKQMLRLHKLHMPASPLPLAVQLDLSLHGWQLLVLANSTAESHFVFHIFSNSLN